MKQLALSLFLLTIIACSKDDEISFNASDLKGTWNLAALSCTDGKITTEILGQSSTATFVTSSRDHNATVVLGENPNTYNSSGSYTAVVKTTTAGVTETQESPFEDFNLTGTWKLDGNMLIVTTPGEPEQKAEITRLDANNLEYKLIVNETFNEFGFKIITTGTYITKLTR
jgi:hypothetical protein